MEADVRFAIGAAGIENSRASHCEIEPRLASLFADDAASADPDYRGLIADNPAVAGFKIYQAKRSSSWIHLSTSTQKLSAIKLLSLYRDRAEEGRTGGSGGIDRAGAIPVLQRYDVPAAQAQDGDGEISIDPAAKAETITFPSATPSSGNPLPPRRAPERLPRPHRCRTAIFRHGLPSVTTFAAGLAAIFTPCVFPMIPFTVSYFINRNRRRSAMALCKRYVFLCGRHRVLHRASALITKAIAGPIGVVKLGNSPWVNGFHRIGVHRVRSELARCI